MTGQLTILEGKIEKILTKVPGAKEMELIKEVGSMTVAGFICEVGDLRNYTLPRQIQKLDGLNLGRIVGENIKGKAG